MATTSAIVYYSLIDSANEHVPIDSLPCNHNLVAKGFLARNLTHGKAIHRVYLSNLHPNRRYCYEIASGHASSNLYSFWTTSDSAHQNKNGSRDYATSLILNGNKYVQQRQDKEYLIKNELFDLITEDDAENARKNTFPKLVDSLAYQISNRRINAFVNLPEVDLDEFFRNSVDHRASHFDQDFLDRYLDVLSNVQILPAITNYGIIKKNQFLVFVLNFICIALLNT